MPAPRAHVEKTCARGCRHTQVFSACHTPHTTTHHTTRRQTKRDRDKERRGDEREEDREDKTTVERTEDSFSVWWCMAFFVGVVLCLVKPVNARVLSLLNSVKYDSSLISVPLGRSTVFYYLRINFSMQLQFSFFLNFFCLCSYSFKVFRIIYLCSYSFFFAGINSA